MGADAGFLKLIGPELERLLPELDEKARRLTLGAVARAAGDGGIGAVARLTGASWQTVADGAAELESGQVAAPGRVRRPGAGRPRLAGTDPGLVPALLALVADSARGDPESPLLWTTKSAAHLAGELTARGHACSPQTVWRLLRGQGFSTQANAKAKEGRRHPDRDAQFRYIAAQAKEHLAAGQPVISVDAKKKEQVGEYAQAGREWRPKGDPVKVRDHSFADREPGHAIPYGACDVAANAGFVNVGTGGNTAALAVESIRRWWQLAGQDAYPAAGRLLVTCDAGGSNGAKNRAWKAGLAALAAETGLEITVLHFPPGTSKWNQIEHRLFSQITLGWRGRPLTSYDVVINTISAVTTRTGLAVTAVLDRNPCPTGTRISDQQAKDIEERHLTPPGPRHPGPRRDRPSSASTLTMSASTARSWARMRCRSPSSSATRRSRPRRDQATTPSVPVSVAKILRLIGPHAFWPPQSRTAARTAAVNASSPIAASRAGCPPHWLVTSCMVASQVFDSNGWAQVSVTAGHATDKKSPIRCTAAVASVISCARRRPRCRRCAQVSSSSSGI